MICAENEELKKRAENKGLMPGMEVQALERDIENQRNGWEEKAWDLDSAVRNEYKKLEELMLECNQCLRRLKRGNGSIECSMILNSRGLRYGLQRDIESPCLCRLKMR